MGRLVKCPHCQTQVDKDEAVTRSKRYYHQECLEALEMERQQRKELLDYICKLYKIDVPTGFILKQVKDFQEKYNYKLKGMELALRYFYETLDKPVDSQGIGIIPFVYEDAKKHYIMKMKVEQSLINGTETVKSKTVTVEPTKFTYKKQTKQIDISLL